jgi:hypothetical protein
MIGKLTNGAWALFIYVCVGTIISQIVILMYLVSAWKIDNHRWLQIVSVAQGVIPVEEKEAEAKSAEEKVAEQPSYSQVLESRSQKYRNLELREQQLRNSLSNLQFEQNKLVDEKKRYQQIRDGFDAKMLSMSEGATASGRDEVRRTLENIKPKQAKALLLEMLNNKEIDEVVTLLSPMTDAKRAKILAEFKSEDEMEKLSEVLQRIWNGLPSAKTPETTRKQLGELQTTQR